MLTEQSINPLLLQELFLSPLHIDNKYAAALAMSAYLAFSSGKPVDNTRYVQSYCVDPLSGLKVDTQSKPGAVAVVVIDGPIVSASEPAYGIKGTLEAAQELLANDANPNILGHVLALETGGGAVYAIKPIVDVMNSLQKPVVVHSKQILASAGYRIAANADYIMMYHPQGIVGSLGTMISMSDMQPMFEKWGMKFFEYYASASSLKNKTFRDAKQGDGTAIIDQMLNPMNDLFLQEIKALRGDKLDNSEESIFQGETYFADPQGLKLGLIDGVGSFADAIAKVVELAYGETPSSINSSFKNTSTMLGFGSKFPTLSALTKLTAENVTAAHVEAINKEIAEEKVPGVTLCLDSELSATIALATENSTALAAINAVLGKENAKATLTEAVAALSDSAAATASSLKSMTDDRDNWKAKAVEYGAKNADEPTETKQDGPDKPEGDKPNPFYSQADAEMAELRAKAGMAPKK